jgi:hypothetical protein
VYQREIIVAGQRWMPDLLSPRDPIVAQAPDNQLGPARLEVELSIEAGKREPIAAVVKDDQSRPPQTPLDPVEG